MSLLQNKIIYYNSNKSRIGILNWNKLIGLTLINSDFKIKNTTWEFTKFENV